MQDPDPPCKRIRLDNGGNNKIDSPEVKETEKFSCTSDTSLIESDVLEDMGVSPLAEGEASSDSFKALQTQECTISPKIFDKENCLESRDSLYGTQESYKNASFERVQQVDEDRMDQFESDEAVTFSSTNESGYSSRVEIDNLVECKETFTMKEDSNDATDKGDTDPSFFLIKRKKKSYEEEQDKFSVLSDEIILMIFKLLPKKCLVRSMLVCKRWHQIARDEVLWARLDLGSKVLGVGALGNIIPRGIQILRLAQAEIAHPSFLENSDFFSENYTSKLQYLDLSMAVILPDDLACLLSKCKYLKKLSVEKCTVNESCCESISNNKDLSILNLTMCDGMSLDCVKFLMKLTRLSSLNVAWCSLDIESVGYLCKSLPASITRLNIAGCRKTMTDENLQDLIQKCPALVELDLSDNIMLTNSSMENLITLEKLEHLSLSRCYSIHTSLPFMLMKNLKFLDMYGLLSEDLVKTFKAEYGFIELNKFMFSSIARPTVRDRRTSIWGLRVRD